MIYIIGVDHNRAQRKKRGEDLTECQREFQSVVELAIQSIQPGLIAEEDHPEFLSADRAESILLEIANARGLKSLHRFVDPNKDDRRRIGYDISRCISTSVQGLAHLIVCHYPKREDFWFRNLQGSLDKDILFVCGWGHTESFTALLAGYRVSYSVLADRIGAQPTELEHDDMARRYVKDNPLEFKNPICFRLSQSPTPLT
jgi:hypothetical protein